MQVGTYPWAGAGTVNKVAPPAPDEIPKVLAACKALRGSASVVIHD